MGPADRLSAQPLETGSTVRTKPSRVTAMPTLHDDVLSWASDIDPAAIAQAQRTAALPFVVKPLALMADAHVGFGSTVGSVIATEGAIIPSAVGVDIGCGMVAVETSLTSLDLPENLEALHTRIAQTVPAGVGQGHETRLGVDALQVVPYDGITGLTDKQKETSRKQFGSLGSGNHFVEVCLDERDVVWVVLHSGSRGIGNQLATAHIEEAKGLMRQWFIDLPDVDLAYLPEGAPEFDAYIKDMLWAQRYAWENRALMMDTVLDDLFAVVGSGRELDRVNCHHNFTRLEAHRGRNLWITRKGAICAREGTRGVIPGSMGTRSYIVAGKGSKASFESSSHGAGRRLSRMQARRLLTSESLVDAMKGKAWNNDPTALLDEHPEAYKDIDQVMADQADLVTIEHTLSQVLNYKGA